MEQIHILRNYWIENRNNTPGSQALSVRITDTAGHEYKHILTNMVITNKTNFSPNIDKST